MSASPAAAVRSARGARLVLLAVLTAGFGALAHPAARPHTLTAYRVFEPPALTARILPAAPAHRQARASRSRVSRALWVRPVSAGIVSPYGMRWGRLHEGVDFGASYGESIHAVGDGVVIGTGYLADEGGYGQLVLVRHAGGVITAYAHMSKVLAHAGQRVRAGDVLGKVGSTGHSTGPHLHFEVRIDGEKVNPVPWLRAHGVHV